MTVAEAPHLDVLVVDDEPAFREALLAGLSREGFSVHTASDGVEALEQLAAVDPDLVLLDVMLPKMSGVDVCREIRKSSQVPVIMVSAKGEEIDAVVGLEVGADDYVSKPYRLRELVARMRAVMRRFESAGEGATPEGDEDEDVIIVGAVTLFPERHQVTVDGDQVHLPLKEFDLLEMLLENAGRVVTRDRLIDVVWGNDYVGDTKTLDVHIKRLRAKVEPDPAEPVRITTVRGVGYRFERP